MNENLSYRVAFAPTVLTFQGAGPGWAACRSPWASRLARPVVNEIVRATGPGAGSIGTGSPSQFHYHP